MKDITMMKKFLEKEKVAFTRASALILDDVIFLYDESENRSKYSGAIATTDNAIDPLVSLTTLLKKANKQNNRGVALHLRIAFNEIATKSLKEERE